MPFTPAEVAEMERQDERIRQQQRERNAERAARAREQAEVRRINQERFDRELSSGYGFIGHG
jgi:hypothetical protein